jgi:hypothetical protein
MPTIPDSHAAIILSRPFDLPPWLTPIINALLPFVDAAPHNSKIAVAAFDSFWRSHRELMTMVMMKLLCSLLLLLLLLCHDP